jgi:hypothetical protein
MVRESWVKIYRHLCGYNIVREEGEGLGRLWAGLVSGVWVLLLLVAVFGVVLNVPVVRKSGTICLCQDGRRKRGG